MIELCCSIKRRLLTHSFILEYRLKHSISEREREREREMSEESEREEIEEGKNEERKEAIE